MAAERPRGSVVEVPNRDGTLGYALRFRADGRRRYVTLGIEPEWTRGRAEEELRYVLAQVERGAWKAGPRRRRRPVQVATSEITFQEFASEWFELRRHEWKPATVRAYRDELELHLLPWFARKHLAEITIAEIDRYKSAKLAERAAWREAVERRGKAAAGRPPIGAPTINKTLTRLGQILEQAVEYGHIDRNPARGKRRKLKVTTPPRSHLDQAEHFEALLEAAGELDRAARDDRRHIGRRAMLAALMFGGLRISELLELRWREVDLAAGRIRVGERGDDDPDAKTQAGFRLVRMLPILRDELSTWKARTAPRPGAYVFASSEAGRMSESNVRNRVLAPAIARANTALEAADLAPLPPRLTPHGLRHSFASLLVALGKDPRFVMDQLGHTDASFTLRLYTHAMRQDDGDIERLKALVNGSLPDQPREGWVPATS